ncbi:Proton-dependent oligopeptide transporter family [Macleaya cordata]|uniref:Proton-dependent oligopeptide transporter family n=1 Tax=Macleaya cordata TaxID=56857 RepID=A0A200Q6N4_MACCD|nr:Proton-dependent oligopeptide transporter family [Macleaya cordata]
MSTVAFIEHIKLFGLGLLTLSVVLPSLTSPLDDCLNKLENGNSCNSPSSFQVTFFFFSLYLVAVGRGGFKPCAQAFGADQFDGQHPEECKSKSSFFNWWSLGLCVGSSISHLALNYIQDNLGWGLGFGIPCISMALALIIFLFGTKIYRFTMKEDKDQNLFFRITQVFVVAAKNWRTTSSSTILQDEEIGISHHVRVGAHQFKFLDKALIYTSNGCSRKQDTPCSISQVEDAKAILRLVPIWMTCSIYAVVFAQYSTFFTKQGKTMDRSIGPEFQIPAASIQIFISLSVIIFITIYDRLFVPLARTFTGKPNGITMLQRIGVGIFLSVVCMVIAAIIEQKRLQIALDFGLIDVPEATVPMSVWWLVPQYVLFGLSGVFAVTGLQEFFYDQVPEGLRSVGLSLFSSIFGIGSFLSSFLISFIERVTSGTGRYSWFSNNLNRAHLDYFYWLLAGLSAVQFSVDCVVDYRGDRVINRSKFGGWKSASLIIIVEIFQMFAYYGISSNLISYLTGPLGQSNTTAAENINAWTGVMWMLPLLAAFVSDSYLGRFRTILLSSLIYILGLGLLTLSVMLPSLNPPDCPSSIENNTSCTSPSSFQVIFFFSSLYLVAIGRAGYKPCAQAFGADQFDGRNLEECKSKSSFFNWWGLGLYLGSTISHLILNYIQDNLSWGLGFGIPCVSMIVALVLLLLGMKTYRYSVKEDKENPLLRIVRVFLAAAKNWRTTSSSTIIQEEEIGISHHFRLGAHQFKFLDKALIDISNDPISSRKLGVPCTISQVEDAKAILRLVPIWITCLMYAVVFSQSMTFFTKQGNTMDRSIGPEFQIPAASIHIFVSISSIIFIAIYDRLFIPLSRAFTNKPNGITMLQRIGCGMVLSIISMMVAAIIEKKRLQTASDFGLIDMPKAIVPMSVWWLIPQYVLTGVANVFTMIGLQEFFYDQMPNGLRSVGLSLFNSIFGIGSFLSGFLISVIEKVTRGNDQYSWFSDNLNRAHLDYFYLLLGGLSIVEFAAYLDSSSNNFVEGVVDYRGERVIDRSKHGGWRSASLVIVVEIAQTFTYFGISSNLISYLTGPLRQPTVVAAANVNAWVGVMWMLPLVSAFLADSYLGQFRTIIFSSLIYILGLALLILSTAVPSLRPPSCSKNSEDNASCPSPSSFQVFFFFSSLYLIAIGNAGYKPIIVHLILNYIQDYLSWGLGFGIPSAENWRTTSSSSTTIVEEIGMPYRIGSSHQFKFLDKALIIDTSSELVGSTRKQGIPCSISQVEDAKALLRLAPIWITCLIYSIVVAQLVTFFTKQASTMDRSLGSEFQIPAASIQIFSSLSFILFIIIYDRLFVPFARTFTSKSNGITILQRVGGGLFLSIITMVVAAIVEKKRLQTALDFGLIDMPKATVPMSVWWLIPQNVLHGLTSVLAKVGLQEFFYDQVPHGLRTMGVSLFFSLFGTGNFLSSLLISVIEKVTGGSSPYSSWFPNNLNQAHLDYFYWLLAGLSIIQFAAYLYFSKSYLYNIRRM